MNSEKQFSELVSLLSEATRILDKVIKERDQLIRANERLHKQIADMQIDKRITDRIDQPYTTVIL